MKNQAVDLNNILFAQLERLSQEDITQEELDKELERCAGIGLIADKLIELAKVEVTLAKVSGSEMLPTLMSQQQKSIGQ